MPHCFMGDTSQLYWTLPHIWLGGGVSLVSALTVLLLWVTSYFSILKNHYP
jgi:hypothetical protein